MSDDRTEEGPEVRGRIGFDERETLMCYLLRDPAVFLEARTILTPGHFSEPYEVIWGTCWRSMCDLYDQFGAMPAHMILEADALSRVDDNPDELPPGGVEEIHNFLEFVFTVDMTALQGSFSSYGFEMLQKFLKERHWADPMRSYLQEIGTSVPVDLPALLRDYSDRLVQITGIQSSVMEPLIPDHWESSVVTRTPTGLSFIDNPMGGGWVPGEVYGLLGPYGGGKTMMEIGRAHV